MGMSFAHILQFLCHQAYLAIIMDIINLKAPVSKLILLVFGALYCSFLKQFVWMV